MVKFELARGFVGVAFPVGLFTLLVGVIHGLGLVVLRASEERGRGVIDSLLHTNGSEFERLYVHEGRRNFRMQLDKPGAWLDWMLRNKAAANANCDVGAVNLHRLRTDEELLADRVESLHELGRAAILLHQIVARREQEPDRQDRRREAVGDDRPGERRPRRQPGSAARDGSGRRSR